jgi:hypothetical protein
MNKYRLFSEWRVRTLYGISLEDAVMREKQLQRPDRFMDGNRIPGDKILIIAFHGMRDTSNSTRGSSPFVSGLFELDDGKIVDVDAVESPAGHA